MRTILLIIIVIVSCTNEKKNINVFWKRQDIAAYSIDTMAKITHHTMSSLIFVKKKIEYYYSDILSEYLLSKEFLQKKLNKNSIFLGNSKYFIGKDEINEVKLRMAFANSNGEIVKEQIDDKFFYNNRSKKFLIFWIINFMNNEKLIKEVKVNIGLCVL